MTAPVPALLNLKHPTATHWTSGQPSPEQLAGVRAAGITHIINLRPPTEDAGFDETATLAQLGLHYTVLPVAGPAGLTLENVRKFDALLGEAGSTPTLIHCASGNRVGALMALRAGWLHGASPEAALQIGADYGLTAMMPAVAALLAQPPR